MIEQTIGIEVAKLAKFKGFKENTRAYYHPSYGFCRDTFSEDDSYNSDKWAPGYYAAPSQSLLQKWLREKHNIHIHILLNAEKDFGSYVNYKVVYIRAKMYEEALEAGLFEALSLI